MKLIFINKILFSCVDFVNIHCCILKQRYNIEFSKNGLKS